VKELMDIFETPMGKASHILIKLSIVFISLLCIDGGGSFLVTGSNWQLLTSHDKNSDIEVPHNHQLLNLNDDEKWIEKPAFDFICKSKVLLKFVTEPDSPVKEYSCTVWQPPRFV
jgi:hypothetical protein